MRRPLRSKRAITSPVRARWKASGFTRISVRLTFGAPLGSFGRWRPLGCRGSLRGRWCRRLRLRRLLAFARRRLPFRFPGPVAERRLAVGAERPAGIDGLAAARAGVLEAFLAFRAAQVALLDRVLAVRAGSLGQLADAQLRRTDLE